MRGLHREALTQVARRYCCSSTLPLEEQRRDAALVILLAPRATVFVPGPYMAHTHCAWPSCTTLTGVALGPGLSAKSSRR